MGSTSMVMRPEMARVETVIVPRRSMVNMPARKDGRWRFIKTTPLIFEYPIYVADYPLL